MAIRTFFSGSTMFDFFLCCVIMFVLFFVIAE